MKLNKVGWYIVCAVLFVALMVGMMFANPGGEIEKAFAQGGTPTPDQFQSNIFMWDGGDTLFVADGGKVIVQSGGEIELESGGVMDNQSYLLVGGPTPAVITTPGAGDVVVKDDVEVQGDIDVAGSGDFDSWVNVAIPTAQATATPGVVVNNLSVAPAMEIRDASTPIASWYADGSWDVHGQKIDLDADNDTSLTVDTDDQVDLEINGADEYQFTGSKFDLTGNYIEADQDTEHIMFPSVLSVPITYTAAAGGTGVIATITNGEIWFIHDILVNVTEEWTATAGDDETLVIGDGEDADGFLVLDHTDLTATYNEGVTGHAAGWLGKIEANVGVYFDPDGTDGFHNNTFVYAPSGADETIDYTVACTGDDCTAGAATVYVVYTRVQ